MIGIPKISAQLWLMRLDILRANWIDFLLLRYATRINYDIQLKLKLPDTKSSQHM